MIQPSFISQYGPLLAALLALLGVVISLVVTGRRNARDATQLREDAYRREVREAVASVLTESRRFRRLGVALADLPSMISLGYQAASKLRDDTDSSMEALGQKLISASLLAQDQVIVDALGAVMQQHDNSSAAIHEAMDSFWQRRPPSDLWHRRHEAFTAFDSACAELHIVARETLAPTVRNEPKK